MSRLEELIAEHCPDGVEYVKLNELLDYEQSTKYIAQDTDYNDEGLGVVVIAASGIAIRGYTETGNPYIATRDKGVILQDERNGSFRWYAEPFCVHNSKIVILRPRENSTYDFLMKYVYYAMRNLELESGEPCSISKSSHQSIPLPPSKTQRDIVNFLDKFHDKERIHDTRVSAHHIIGKIICDKGDIR